MVDFEHVRAEHLRASCWLAAAVFSALPVVFSKMEEGRLGLLAKERNYMSRGVNDPSTKPNKTISMIQPTG